jgi:hypothetical protein
MLLRALVVASATGQFFNQGGNMSHEFKLRGAQKAKQVLTGSVSGEMAFNELLDNLLRHSQPVGPTYEVQDIKRDGDNEIKRVVTQKRHPMLDAAEELSGAIATLLKGIDTAKTKGVKWS